MNSPHRPAAARRGRDRGAVVITPAPGAARAGTPAPRTAVVGGGIAGLAAATGLAERGVRVTLYERDPQLGGRLAGWPTGLGDGSTPTMSRGFHAFFRQYYNLRGLLRRVDGGLGMLRGMPDYPLVHRDGLRDSFRHVPRTPPWNAVAFTALSRSFRPRDLLQMSPRSALPLFDVRVPDVYEQLDGVSAMDYLDSIRFPASARHLAFEVFSRSFFADPRELSAAELVLMFHIYFLGSSEGLLFDVPNEPYPQALWDPLAHYLKGHGAELRTATPVTSVRPRPDGGFTVHSGTRAAEDVDAVVLALDTGGLRAVVGRSPDLGDGPWRGRVDRLRTAPPFLVSRLWLDRPVRADRPGFLGTGGFGSLDNISVLELWEGEAARWAAAHGGSVVELHAYAVTDTDREAAQEHLVEQLHQVYPETRDAKIVDIRHEWRDDCPLFPVGRWTDRPTVRTPHPHLTVAGDLVRPDLPVALMERAATTGFQAANVLLETWGVRGQTLWSVPTAGRSAPLRALARFADRPTAPRS
ncbi:FAD-dependent oxidoreductase [Streptomyces sp. 549]|uniref:FAD-dependent oxidoreductase n=1 Tax=Streptomyces sp. 549 TaxID=3049076 RepID=UPI0024C3E0CB|nr:FAD-dependent oxidoreductase [Streptomyces sp. 549]MDK1474597.1 FAD-dependent oxidoreductase [Streptomyces sp. 549]